MGLLSWESLCIGIGTVMGLKRVVTFVVAHQSGVMDHFKFGMRDACANKM